MLTEKQKRALVITVAIFVVVIVVAAVWNSIVSRRAPEVTEGTPILPETIERLSANPDVPPLPPLSPEVLKSLGSDR